MNRFDFSDGLMGLAEASLDSLQDRFGEIDAVAEYNTKKVLSAFAANRVSDAMFAGTTGYGYDDRGRSALENVYAQVFGAEAALVRTSLISGTHAITAALYGALRPGETLLYATGAPYDTLRGVIGTAGEHHGSLKFYGIGYRQVEMTAAGGPDYRAIAEAAADKKVRVVAIQRSRGYSTRRSVSIDEIGEICACVKKVNPGAVLFVDNCYGEFVEMKEPAEAGADLLAGSLIKNPGGGLAPAGGYVAGRRDLVENAAARMSAPGIGGEGGATLGTSRLLYQGFFMAPHTAAQALKTALFCAGLMELLGYKADPGPGERRTDIIQMVEFGNPEDLKRFCAGIQRGAPVDSFVTPEFSEMPGYDCPVIMAAGSFIQGASIELSADGPLRAPYAAYVQGGLTFESGKLGIMAAARSLTDQ